MVGEASHPQAHGGHLLGASSLPLHRRLPPRGLRPRGALSLRRIRALLHTPPRHGLHGEEARLQSRRGAVVCPPQRALQGHLPLHPPLGFGDVERERRVQGEHSARPRQLPTHRRHFEGLVPVLLHAERHRAAQEVHAPSPLAHPSDDGQAGALPWHGQVPVSRGGAHHHDDDRDSCGVRPPRGLLRHLLLDPGHGVPPAGSRLLVPDEGADHLLPVRHPAQRGGLRAVRALARLVQDRPQLQAPVPALAPDRLHGGLAGFRDGIARGGFPPHVSHPRGP
mmetsp:Transcript_43375/g.134057  ORF Transcript_43375/g.134057 Transcript_43375/m.134057 type:complete len:280 (+) Transcript_43375:705-1544(+)